MKRIVVFCLASLSFAALAAAQQSQHAKGSATAVRRIRLGNATDLAKTDSKSEISRASNSFLEQLPVPELGTMELMVTGILTLAGAGRRRNSK